MFYLHNAYIVTCWLINVLLLDLMHSIMFNVLCLDHMNSIMFHVLCLDLMHSIMFHVLLGDLKLSIVFHVLCLDLIHFIMFHVLLLDLMHSSCSLFEDINQAFLFVCEKRVTLSKLPLYVNLFIVID